MVRYATAGVGITPSSSTSAPTEQMPAWGLYIRHADDVTLDNVKLHLAAPDVRTSAVVLDDALGVSCTDCNFALSVCQAP